MFNGIEPQDIFGYIPELNVIEYCRCVALRRFALSGCFLVIRLLLTTVLITLSDLQELFKRYYSQRLRHTPD